VRYYVAKRVVPPPVGAPKLARYEVMHLARIVGVRLLQDAGKSLAEANAQLDGWAAEDDEQLLSRVQDMLSLLLRSTGASADPDSDAEDGSLDLPMREIRFPDEVSVTRVQVVPGVVIEIEQGIDREEAAEAIREILELL